MRWLIVRSNVFAAFDFTNGILAHNFMIYNGATISDTNA